MPLFTLRGARRIARQTTERERQLRGGLPGRPADVKTPRIAKKLAKLSADLAAATWDGTSLAPTSTTGVLLKRTSGGWTITGGISTAIFNTQTSGGVSSTNPVQVAWIDGRWVVDVEDNCP